MSSKSHLIYTQNTQTEVYQETNAGQYAFDKFVGYDIECQLDFRDINGIKFNDGMLHLSIQQDSELYNLTNTNAIRLYGTDLTDVEIDKEGISFTIRGGSLSAKLIETKAWVPANYKSVGHE